MPVRRLPESHLTLYSELLDQMIPAEAEAVAEGSLSGSFTSKKIKGNTYWYLQRSEGSKLRQIYLGPDSPQLKRWMEKAAQTTEISKTDHAARRRLGKMLVSGGASSEPAATLKVLRMLSESRVFHLGGVLIGTLAFRTYANVFGVRFRKAALQTQDVDIAHDRAIGVALARDTSSVQLEEIIEKSGLNLHPVPPLDRNQPSTSFKVRGRDLRVDFLTPMTGRETSKAAFLPAFGLSARPLQFLDYLIKDPIPAVVMGADVVLVNIPSPARFAMHKLWTSTQRPAGFQAKAAKDRIQAEQLIEVLIEDRPNDLSGAWDALTQKARTLVRSAMKGFEPETALGVIKIIDAD
ncbi:MAG: GSU2403 family nucleotidyltransferase fold protein [Thermodesulfobacteriota bacterium]